MEKHTFIGRHGFMHTDTTMKNYHKYPYFDIRIETGFMLFLFHWKRFCWYIGYRSSAKLI